MRPLLFVSLIVSLQAPMAVPVAAQGDPFDRYATRPDQWRPASPATPGVDARGDLSLEVPLLTVPGRAGLDFPVRLSYTAGIRYADRGSWVGTGWRFDPGSITRDVFGVLSTTGTPANVDFTDQPAVQPDAYYITLPGTTATMVRHAGTGTVRPIRQDSSGFYLTEWRPWRISARTASPVTVAGQQTLVDLPGAPPASRSDYRRFVITGEDGTRYVFDSPTLATYYGINANLAGRSSEQYVATWRLVAVLGPHYRGPEVPTGGEPGSWIKLVYGDGTTAGSVISHVAQAPEARPDGADRAPLGQSMVLMEIVTPTHRAVFATAPRGLESFSPWEQREAVILHRRLVSVTLFARNTGSAGEDARVVRRAALEPAAVGFPSLGTGERRLALGQIRFFGRGAGTNGQPGPEEPGYRFDYYRMEDEAGDINTTDDFGYYTTRPRSHGYDGDSDDGKAWSLRSITYPSGGWEEFDYENDFIQPGNLSYGRFNAATGASNQPYYAVGAGLTRQGGTRLIRVRRYDAITSLSGSPTPVTTSFAYGSGRLSAPPPLYWSLLYGGYRLFVGQERGTATVYYDAVERLSHDGARVVTRYTTPATHPSAVRPVETVVWDWPHSDGGPGGTTNPSGIRAMALAQGNQGWSWGHPYEVEYRSPARTVRRVTRTYALQGYEPLAAGTVPHLAIAWPTGVSARVEWSYGPRLLREDALDIGTTGLAAGPSTAYAYFDQRTAGYPDASTGNGMIRTVTGLREDGRRRRTMYTYGPEVYSASRQMVAANRLDAIVREDLLELDAAEAVVAYHASRITRWREVDPVLPGQIPLGGDPLFVPYDEYEWAAPQPSATRPDFGAWAGGTPGGAWQRVSSNESYDTNGLPLRVLDARGFQSVVNYDAAGRINRVERETGEGIGLVQSYGYDPHLGRLTSVVDENGSRLTYAYDEQGRLTEERDRFGAVVATYAYQTPREADGRMHRVRPDRVMTTRWTGVTPDRNVEIEFFDGLGRSIQRQVMDEGGQYIVHGRRFVNPTGASAAVQERVPIRQPTAGNYVSNLVWMGATTLAPLVEDEPQPLPSMFQNYTETRFIRDGTGRVQGVTFPNEGAFPIAQTFASYDVEHVAGRPLRVTSQFDESSDRTETWTDGWGHDVRTRRRATASTFENGLVTETDRDVAGRPTAVRPPNYFDTPHGVPASWVSTSQWDTRGRLTRTTSPDAGETLHAHDAAGNLRFTQDAARRAAGEFVATRYDALGRPLRTGVYPLSAAGVSDFSQLDPTRPYSETPWENDASRWVEVSAYDQRPSATTAPWSAFAAQVGAFQATFARGRLIGAAVRSDGAWQIGLNGYDAEQRLARQTLHTQDAPNAPGMAAYDTDHRYGYDRQDRVVTREIRLGAAGPFRHWYDYSVRGLPVRLYAGTSPGRPATPDVTWTHTESGRVATIRNGTATPATLVYDLRERLIRIGGPVATGVPAHAFQAEYVYAADGDVVQAAFYQRHVGAAETRDYWAYCYDDFDRLHFAANVPGGMPEPAGQCDPAWGVTPDTPYSVASLTYDANGNIRTMARLDASGAVVDDLTYGYEPGTNRLTSIADAGLGGALNWDLETGPLAHDANGNVTRLPPPYAVSTASYDWRDRLTTATAAGSEVRYRYGATGARYMERVSEGGIESDGRAPGPQSRRALSVHQQEDGDRPGEERGRRQPDDADGVAPSQPTASERPYRPRFARPSSYPTSEAGGEEVTFSAIDAIGARTPAAVRSDDGAVSFNLLAPDGEVVGRQPSSGGRLYYLRDNLASVRAVVDGAGNAVESRAYDAWGLALAGRTSGQPATSQGFTGKERDPLVGGPLGGLDDFGARSYAPLLGRFMQVDPAGDSFPGWSPYTYTLNRPASLVDPDGRAPTPMDWYYIGGRVVWRNHTGKLEENGITYQSLGRAFVHVEHARDPATLREPINGARLSFYTAANRQGPTVTIRGNTVPADPTDYGTLSPGIYGARRGSRSRYPGEAALLIGNGGPLGAEGANPNNDGNRDLPIKDHYMTAIFAHVGNTVRQSLGGASPISMGCITGYNGPGGAAEWRRFMAAVPTDFDGLLLLTGMGIGAKGSSSAVQKHRDAPARLYGADGR